MGSNRQVAATSNKSLGNAREAFLPISVLREGAAARGAVSSKLNGLIRIAAPKPSSSYACAYRGS